MLPIVIATGNPHKVDELRAIFRGSFDLCGLGDLPGPLAEPQETGSTFEANATIKALSYAAQTGRLCLADDSGLEIDALGGRPGVISSHYCTDGRETGMSRAERDAANNARVLREMSEVPEGRRAARFVCVMALAGPGDTPSTVTLARGTFEGHIGMRPDVPRGDHGFGYDPIFLLSAPDQRSSAELAPELKNQLSHRAAAARAMTPLIAARLAREAERR